MACTHVFLSELLLIRLTKTHVRRRIYPTPTSVTEDPPFLESLEFLRFAVFTSFATFADGRKSTQGISCWKVSISKRFRQNSKSPFSSNINFSFSKIANQLRKIVNTAMNVPFFRQLGVRRYASFLPLIWRSRRWSAISVRRRIGICYLLHSSVHSIVNVYMFLTTSMRKNLNFAIMLINEHSCNLGVM